jgi:hypothetical protein
MTGKKVFELNNIKGTQLVLPKGDLKTGMYFAKLYSDKNMLTQKISVH